MVSVSKIEGGPQVLSASVRMTIQSIKEIVGGHSDADIYVALKEANMDPNETTQKLLFQDSFHEVKRKKDRKKENSESKGPVAPDIRKAPEITQHLSKHTANPDHNPRRAVPNRKNSPDVGASQAFRVVKDNRVNRGTTTDSKPAQSVISKNENALSGEYVKRSDSKKVNTKDATRGNSEVKEGLEDKKASIPKASSRAHVKANGFKQHSTYSSSAPVVGVYSSSSDPIHVPSLHPRHASNAGAIRREFGVVGSRRQLDGNATKQRQGNLSSNVQTAKDMHARESARQFNSSSGSDGLSKNVISESGFPGVSAHRSSNNQYGSKLHQPMGYQKASHPNMEWKPKAGRKPIASAPAEIHSSPRKNIEEFKDHATDLQDSISQLRISENQNVIIAPHIRVPEMDRCRLIFGSLDAGSDSVNSSLIANTDAPAVEPFKSSELTREPSEADPTFSKQLDTRDEAIQLSESSPPHSSVTYGNEIAEKNESSDSQDLESYADVGLIQTSSPGYTPQPMRQEENELPSFSGYDPQLGYDTYFRPAIDDTLRVPLVLPSQEVLSSHVGNAMPAPSVAMVQQQQQQMAQMYPHLHVSHFGNVVPYRQFVSPVYVPPMPVPGYSNNPAYHHPSNGNNFLLMPGNNSHLPPNGAVKYGVQQFKPVPTANMNGFGNFTNPTGYALNTNGVIGSTVGLDDSSRIKYKENLYVPNPQPETTEIWMNPRDLPSLQSASYYSMAGQTPHPAYLTSHGSHASFNAAAAAVVQSSHMQFPNGMYHHSPQPTAIQNPHISPVGGNVGIGVPAPPAPGGAYQQPQLGHLNWTGNF